MNFRLKEKKKSSIASDRPLVGRGNTSCACVGERESHHSKSCIVLFDNGGDISYNYSVRTPSSAETLSYTHTQRYKNTIRFGQQPTHLDHLMNFIDSDCKKKLIPAIIGIV